jgi:hypothetical protein
VNHLDPGQLSAFLDGALPAAEQAMAAAHLAGCETCRAELDHLRAADALIAETRAHDPGDAYFAGFAARVSARIEAEGGFERAGAGAGAAHATAEGTGGAGVETPARPARVRAAAPWWDVASWFRSPARLAWAGSVAALVVTAGVALMMTREARVPDLRSARVLERGGAGHARPAPPDARAQAPPGEAPGDAETGRATAAQGRVPESGLAPESRTSLPARAREMRQGPGGEDLPVARDDAPAFAREPAPPSPAPAAAEAGGTVTVTRPQRAEPLGAAEKSSAAGSREAASATSSLTAEPRRDSGIAAFDQRLDAAACGEVVDARGRPLPRAQVVLGTGGVTASSGEDGRFCLDVARGEYDLTVYAVGFAPLRQRVTLGDPAKPVRLVAQTVEVLPPPVSGERPVPPAAPADLAPPLRASWEEAAHLSREAADAPSAPRYAAAAAAWGDVAARLETGDAALAAREHHAHLLHAAWRAAPTESRAAAARAALHEFIEAAPQGPRRARALELLEGLGR